MESRPCTSTPADLGESKVKFEEERVVNHSLEVSMEGEESSIFWAAFSIRVFQFKYPLQDPLRGETFPMALAELTKETVVRGR